MHINDNESLTMHHMGDGMLSPCGVEPASVYSGYEGGFSTDWADVTCPACLAKAPAGVAAPTPLQKFYLTFGVKYRHERHPKWVAAHPDGWVLIEAPYEDEARRLAHEALGPYWSMLYPASHFPEEYNMRMFYPDGQIGHLIGEYSTPGTSAVITVTKEKS